MKLVRDKGLGANTSLQKISEHAVTILVNLSGDQEILENLATDEKFLDVVFRRIVVRMNCS